MGLLLGRSLVGRRGPALAAGRRRWYGAPVHDCEKYSPKAVERDWYEWWQRRGLFRPSARSGDSGAAGEFSMLLPPPNVTGVLHIGHALTLSIQDAIARWHRMHGRSVNWVPGTDHAGISMQTVVERRLRRERGQTRHDLGREAFVDEVWRWKHAHGSRIKEQTVRIGASLNWDAEFFTMDARHSQVVRDAFIRLYDDGLVYRATRMVNWSCALQSVISDIEVDRVPTSGRVLLQVPGSDARVEFGVLHAVEFPVVDPPAGGPRVLRVETTRPETMLGDVAVAVGSGDPRYRGLAGRAVLHPLLGRAVPIICDDELVDPAYGTGAVKITPAHDEADYACAQRHGLPVVQVFGLDGAVARDGRFGAYGGKSRWEARRAVVAALAAGGAYAGARDAAQGAVALCSRSGDVVEPMLVPQWYVRCSELAQRADALVREGRIELVPAQQRAAWHRWMADIQDWCVSRQLWWGHRVPVYRIVWRDPARPDAWVAAESEQQARAKARARQPGGEDAIAAAVPDEDVLDTWFSSALLPLTAFGRGRGGGGAALSSVLETGQDILFFWVARMAMLCTRLAAAPPFETVLLHPMVRDAQGRKMSKSLGNVIDPMDVIAGAGLAQLQDAVRRGNLPEQEARRSMRELGRLYPAGFQAFGADALRFALVLYTQQTQQINMSIDSVRAAHRFCNKLWNTVRFAHMHAARLGLRHGGGSDAWFAGVGGARLTAFDRAVLSRLWAMQQAYHRAMATHRLAAAAEAVRDFVQRDLCDRYIEVAKPALFGNAGATGQDPVVAVRILLGALDIVLRALHPFMPFLSEELWQRHARRHAAGEMSVMECVWPAAGDGVVVQDAGAEEESSVVFGVVSGIRSVRQKGAGGEAPVAVVAAGEGAASALATVRRHQACIRLLARVDALRIYGQEGPAVDEAGAAVAVVTPCVRVVGTLQQGPGGGAQGPGSVARLEAELAQVQRVIASEGYWQRAPAAVKEADRRRVGMLEARIAAARR